MVSIGRKAEREKVWALTQEPCSGYYGDDDAEQLSTHAQEPRLLDIDGIVGRPLRRCYNGVLLLALVLLVRHFAEYTRLESEGSRGGGKGQARDTVRQLGRRGTAASESQVFLGKKEDKRLVCEEQGPEKIGPRQMAYL